MSETAVREWFSLKEASEITGKSLNAIRLLVHRKKISNVKKIMDNGREQWMVHRETLSALSSAADLKKEDSRCANCTMKEGEDLSVCHEICGKEPEIDGDICLDSAAKQETVKQAARANAESKSPAFVMEGHNNPVSGVFVASIPLDHYEQKQKEWSQERDRLIQGILLYRYRCEDLTNKMKALPAPPEYIQTRVLDLEKQLRTESTAKEEALSNIGRHLEEVRSENQKMREVYEAQLGETKRSMDDMRQRLHKEEEEKTAAEKRLEDREEELLALIAEKEEALTAARKPWWKKMMGY